MGSPIPVLSEFTCDNSQLGQEIICLSGQMNVANYRLLKMIAEFDGRGAWRCGGLFRSCAHWLAAKCGMTIGAARDRLRVARRLAGLPEVDQVFSTGGLSYSKVRAITRVATEQNEGFMVTMAENASASHLEMLVSKYKPVDEFDIVFGGDLSESPLENDSRTDRTAGEPEADSEDVNPGSLEAGAVVGLADPLDPVGSAGLACSESTMDEDEQREQARELFWFQDKEGMWIIHAKLPPEQGQLVMKALEAFARPIQEERKNEWKARQKARLQAVAKEISRRHREAADTEAELAEFESADIGYAEAKNTESGQAEFDDGSGSVKQDAVSDTNHQNQNFGDSVQVQPITEKNSAEFSQLERAREKISAETFSQFMNHVRADAFSAMAEHFLATSGDYHQFQGLKGAERCQVVMHVDINTLREQRSGACCTHSQGHFENKPWLSPKTARRLSCDASLVTVLEDEAGKVLNVSRRSRIVPAHIRRALMERDGVCRFPGCHESRYVDAHHIKHWSEGGETSLDNLAVLCRYHHAQLHRGCYDVRRDNDNGLLIFTTPSGSQITKN